MLEPIKEQLTFNILLALFVTTVVGWICGSVIKRTQVRIEKRNIELTLINHQNEIQKEELELAAKQLSAANQKLSELNNEKDEFISIVAHDLRNPLNGILGLCQLAEHDDASAPFDSQSFVTDIQDCGQRMVNLTQCLLDVSRIESFQGQIDLEAVDCNTLIKQSAAEFQVSAQRKKIALFFDQEPGERHTVQSQPDWLAICINNLVSNAVKYTPIGGKVMLNCRHSDDDVEISIQDNGPGISTDDQAKLFTKFTRLSAKPTGNESSTGLGLYLVKKMCERLQITIHVDTQLGQGTTFLLRIPK